MYGATGRTITVRGATSPDRHDPRRARLLPVQGRRWPGHLRRQGGQPPPAPLQLLRRPPQPPPPHRPDGGHGRVGRVDPGAQRGRGAHARVQPHQAAPAPLQHPAARRQELPVPGRHPRRGVAPGDGDAGPQAQGRPLLRPVRPRLRHPRDARPAAAHVPDPHLLAATSSTSTTGWAGRACCSTSRSARARASARSTTTRYDGAGRRSCSTSSTATPTTIVQRLERQMREAADALEFERAARLRDRLVAVRKAIERQQMVAERNEDIDVIGVAEDELEAAVQVFYVRRGRVVGRKGFIVDKVEDLTPGRARGPDPGGAVRRRAGRSACPSRCSCRPSPRSLAVYEEWLTEMRGSPGAGAGAAAGRQAGAARDRHPQRQGGVHPPPAAAGGRPQQPGPGPERAAGRPRAARGAAAHRVLRHGPHPGHRLRRLDGGDGGRPAPQERVPPLQGEGRGRQRRLRRHGGGADPPPHRLPGRARPARVASGPASSPTRRSCSWSTAARASWRWPSRSCGTSASTRRSRWRRWPSGSRRSTCRARPTRSSIPRQSEALFLLQRIRDEAHRFANTYHRELRGKRMTKSVLDDVRRPRPDPRASAW